MPPLTMPFKVKAAEIILAYVRDSPHSDLSVAFPQPQVHPPYLTIPVHLCSKIMAEVYNTDSLQS